MRRSDIRKIALRKNLLSKPIKAVTDFYTSEYNYLIIVKLPQSLVNPDYCGKVLLYGTTLDLLTAADEILSIVD
jgi:hypothetical protein